MEQDDRVKLLFDVAQGKVEIPLELSDVFNRYFKKTLSLMTEDELKDLQKVYEDLIKAEKNGNEIIS